MDLICLALSNEPSLERNKGLVRTGRTDTWEDQGEGGEERADVGGGSVADGTDASSTLRVLIIPMNGHLIRLDR